MNTRTATRLFLAPFVIALLLTAGQRAHADEITVDGFPFKNVRITGLRDGKIYFIGPAGERSAELERVKGLKLASYPDVEKADAAMAKKDYRGAANLLGKVYKRLREDYLKVLVGRKLVYTLDKSDQFETALDVYVALLNIDASPVVQAVRPTNLPTKDAEKKALKSKVESLIRNARTIEAKQYLKQIQDTLKGDGDADDLKPDLPGAGLGSIDATEAKRDRIAEYIKEGKTDKAQAMIDRQLEDRGVSLSKLLYQQGQIHTATKNDMDALVSFMRVVVHYDPRNTDYYVPSLIEAGKLYQKMGKGSHAKKLWTEAKDIIGDDPKDRDEAAKVQKLLGTL